MRQREDANRTREAGNLDEIQGVVANKLNLFRNGASLLAKAFGVGFIVWLGENSARGVLVFPRARVKRVAQSEKEMLTKNGSRAR